jgi:hypothetical protein
MTTLVRVKHNPGLTIVEDLRTDVAYAFRDETDAAMLRTLLLRAESISVLAAPGADEFVFNRDDGRAEDDLEG